MTPDVFPCAAMTRRRLFALAGCLGVPALPASLKAAERPDCCNFSCDVAVIGGGAAGLAAAIAAHEAGARVLVVEKMPMVGGNSLLACEAMLYAEDPKDVRSAKERSEIARERETFLKQVLARGKTGHEELSRILIEGSPDAVKWLGPLAATSRSAPRASGSTISGSAGRPIRFRSALRSCGTCSTALNSTTFRFSPG